MLSWCVDRDIFNEEATQLRARFDASRGVSPAAAARLLRVRLYGSRFVGNLILIWHNWMVLNCGKKIIDFGL